MRYTQGTATIVPKDAESLGDKFDRQHNSFEMKNNCQIHLLLVKHGIFIKKTNLSHESEKSCDKDKESYKKFAAGLMP